MRAEAKSFLGLCIYFRRPLEDFGDIDKLLYRLMEDKSLFVWRKEGKITFKRLQAGFCSNLTLIFHKIKGQFVLDTNVSNIEE